MMFFFCLVNVFFLFTIIESIDGSSSGDDCFPHVSVDMLSASWSGDRDNLTLKNISFAVNQVYNYI